MPTIATGIFKKLIAKKQSALNTKATASGAQTYGRLTSSIELNKASYQSEEIRPSMQRADVRHGIRSVSGNISAELSCGTFQSFIESVLRAASSTAVTTGAVTDITAAVTTGAAGTYTRGTGSFLTNGFKIGMVVRASGYTTTGVANNAHNFLITALTATVMTGYFLDGVAMGAKASGDTVTIASVGKFVTIPTSGHTRDYYTIEHHFSDIAQSEQFIDCVFSQMDVKLPASGLGTVDFGVMGLNMEASTSAYFTTPAAASTASKLAAVNGALFVAGVKVGLITSLDFSVNGNFTAPGGIVGSNTDPDIFPGPMDITGNISVLLVDATFRDYFINETEVSIVAAFTASNAAAAEFQSHIFPRVKLNAAPKDDGTQGLVMTMPFVALENPSGGTGTATFAGAYAVQDSLFV